MNHLIANLLARSTPIAFRAKGQFWVNNHAHVLQTCGDIPLEYLEFYINSIDLQDYVTGSAQPKLTQDAMNRIAVPVPPFGEQQRIVIAVQRMLAEVEAIKDRLGRVADILSKAPQSCSVTSVFGEVDGGLTY